MPPSRIPAPHSRPLTEASGFLFHRNSLIVSGGVLFLAAWEGFVALVVLLGLILGAAVLSKTWTRLSLVRVSCKRTVRERRLFPGDQTELSLEVANRKPVPLPWVEIEDAIPPELVDENLPPSPWRPNCGSLLRSSSLLGYRRARWKFSLRAGKRGFYSLGPLRLRSGDLFGFYRRMMEVPLPEAIIVYPQIFPISQLLHPLALPAGGCSLCEENFSRPGPPNRAPRLSALRQSAPHPLEGERPRSGPPGEGPRAHRDVAGLPLLRGRQLPEGRRISGGRFRVGDQLGGFPRPSPCRQRNPHRSFCQRPDDRLRAAGPDPPRGEPGADL